MSKAKNEGERAEDLFREAQAILIKREAIAPCDEHDDIMISNMDDEAFNSATALAKDMIERKKIDTTYEEFEDILRQAYDDAAYECEECNERLDRE